MYYLIKFAYYFCVIITLIIAVIFSPIIVFLVGLDLFFDTKIIKWITNSKEDHFVEEIKKCTKNINEALSDLNEENNQHIILYIENQLKRINDLASGIYEEETPTV